jgi:hypothetical protein
MWPPSRGKDGKANARVERGRYHHSLGKELAVYNIVVSCITPPSAER